MRWPNVWTIFRREARDQLRDRRTLFMILVLPVLLYPILGIGVAQLATAFEQKPKTVVVVGAENLPKEPPLLDKAGSAFDVALFDPPSPEEAARLKVKAEPAGSGWADPKEQRIRLRGGEADAVVVIPKDVERSLLEDRSAEIPIAYDAADEASQITRLRVESLINRWKDEIVSGRLRRDKKSEAYTEPVKTQAVNLATGEETGRSVWARLFPFLLVMMSLTGAFYPAVDLCAGEKERGTMETLLISPASRGEIVAGKFLTVMCASMATALLNLGSMAVAGVQIASSLGSIGDGPRAEKIGEALRPPALESGLWMVLLLIPLSAFFSALCVALAVLARSMKEGQYYMTPLYLVAMPLILVTLAPGIELNLFTSLVPITGASLLLKSLMQGDYDAARRYFLPVLLPTTLYSVLALRWAVDQFRRESVLFRESERFEVGAYLRHLIRDRGAPSAAQAILCFALLITTSFFLMTAIGGLSTAGQLVASQVVVIFGVPVLMALLLTRRPDRTLRLKAPTGRFLLLGVGLAIALNPLAAELRPVVEHLFPMTQLQKKAIEAALGGLGGDVGKLLLMVALLPAICEEFAFRGFILSGLEADYRPWSAILISAFLFGFLHAMLSVFTQMFNATLLGVVLGLLAVRSGSLWPGILFHMINNGLAVGIGWLADAPSAGRLASTLFRAPREGLYQWPIVALGALASAGLLAVLVREDEATRPA